jgi:hypothetical protein
MGPNTHKINKKFLQINPFAQAFVFWVQSSSIVMKAKNKILSPSPQRNFELASINFSGLK